MSTPSRPAAFRVQCVCFLLLAGGWSLGQKPGRANDAAKAVDPQGQIDQDVTQGALRVVRPGGGMVECPLKHTDVSAEISGFVARVRVKQTFHNPLKEKIEAVYVFPLPHEAAVDEMTMSLGERKIVGLMKRRAEARQVYEQALLAGQTAALLEQERPNIFTQSVGNVPPGQEVVIEISYVDVLEYDVGEYEFRFPMVVGPRYIPGSIKNPAAPLPADLQGKTSPATPNTNRVPDGSRINPPIVKPGYRNGHDIALSVRLNAGVPIENLRVANHKADVKRPDERQANVAILPGDRLPNKDFVLRYKVSGKKPELALLAHTDRQARDADRVGSGYFMLMVQPREDERLTKSPPREIVFLVDVSGSMSGEPTAKVVEAMQSMLKLCRPIDTVQVVTFANAAAKLFEKPLPVNAANIGRALQFTAGLQGGGGTEMLEGVKLAIDGPLDQERMRIVVMLTDGFIGNEAEIIEHVGRACGDRIRFWCLGIGSSPNMFLVDGVARQGGGMGRTLGLQDDTAGLTQEIMTRIQQAQLAEVRIDYGGLQVSQTYPARIPELWAGRPVVVYGRYSGSGDAMLTVSGEVEGEPTSWTLNARLPEDEPAHDVLAKVWARQKIEALMQQTFYQGSPAVEEEVTGLALQYRLMSPYTSFVAVDQQAEPSRDAARPPRRMLVPVPLPEGTRWEGFFGPAGEAGVDELGEVAAEGAPARIGTGVMNGRYASPGSKRAEELKKRISSMAIDASAWRAVSRLGRESRSLAKSERRLSGRGLGFGGTTSRRPTSGPVAGAFAAAQAGPRARAGAAPGARANAAALSVNRLSVLDDSEIAKESAGQTAWWQTSAALAEQSEELTKRAQAALKAGRQRQKDGQLSDARSELARAWFLAASAGADQIAADALDALEVVHAAEVRTAAQAQPALDKRLDLVIRDQTIEESIKTLSAAAGVDLQLISGSLDDAAALLHQSDVRTTFLDLRGATLAEALDWLLMPVRLEWWLEGGEIAVGTARRRTGTQPWVYDVAAMALTLDSELKGNDEQVAALCKQAASRFFDSVQTQLAAHSTEMAWFAPGELLVIGNPDAHETAARLLAQLAGAKAQLAPEIAALRTTTVKRRAARQADVKQQSAARRLAEVSWRHAHFGWQLLAAAAEDRLDLEALTELQIAWKAPQTAELLKVPQRGVVLRSLWLISEAERALDDQPELKALVVEARTLCQPAIDDLEQTLGKTPNDAVAFLGVLYAALAERSQPATAAARLTLLNKKPEAAADFAAARAVANVLLAQRDSIEASALPALVRGDVAGDDLLVLTALACRRAGGETWQTFRAESSRLLGNQPLPGSVIVLIGRLDSPAFASW